ncbi:hypothetical protein Glove_213g167 [Diversispora epigaea]|uniref:Uncharacterized protein n=1 Tax=Diversispora epigaea TaxID=1348612 RepID=A0A397IRB2_9GLOM|nr:hypothetical protein Glove_213g167 [Diversispora epigaea]
MTSTFTVDAYINSSRKNITSTLTWGTASYKNLDGEIIDFNFKYFNSFGFVHAFEDFSEGDIVNFSGRFTYEENSAYHIEDLNISVPYVNFQCQVKPNAQQKPSTSIKEETLFIETSTFLYSSSSSPPGLHEHFFIISIKKENKRFHSIFSKLTTFYSVSGFLRKIIKCDWKVEFLVEICSFDQLILRSQKSETKRDSKRKRSNPPENTENLFSNPQEVSTFNTSTSFSPDRTTNVKLQNNPSELEPPTRSMSGVEELIEENNDETRTIPEVSTFNTSTSFSPDRTTNVKLQNNPSELEPPTRSMSGVEELIEENNDETRTIPEELTL